MQLSKYFTLDEFTYSTSARVYGIKNNLTDESIINLVRLHDNILLKIREHFSSPLIITSGYRSIELNKKIGGENNSQHCIGQAVDFVIKGCSIDRVFEWCKSNLKFDQLINEKNDWIHISFNINNNRQESLKYDGIKYSKA